MRKRLQNIIAEYPHLYLDDIYFNDNTFEIEIDLYNLHYDDKQEFINDCNNIKKELESYGYKCTYDDEFSEEIYQLYIII